MIPESENRDRDHPQMAAERGRIEPAPRGVRGYFDNTLVFDTIRARYAWEAPYYPQYYIAISDVRMEHLLDEDHPQRLQLGPSRLIRSQATGAPTRPRRVSTTPTAAARSQATCGSNGTRLTGSKKTNKSSVTRATRTSESTRWAPIATSRSRSTASRSPKPAVPSCFSKPGCQPDFISTAPSRLNILTPATPSPSAPIWGSPRYWSARVGDTLHPDFFPAISLLGEFLLKGIPLLGLSFWTLADCIRAARQHSATAR
jgi:uncharacterized protein (DUF427 family)